VAIAAPQSSFAENLRNMLYDRGVEMERMKPLALCLWGGQSLRKRLLFRHRYGIAIAWMAGFHNHGLSCFAGGSWHVSCIDKNITEG
jgi:hypothetical protein